MGYCILYPEKCGLKSKAALYVGDQDPRVILAAEIAELEDTLANADENFDRVAYIAEMRAKCDEKLANM